MPDVYPDPYEFRPERFLDGQPAPYTWIPFGGGVRRCLGAAFAQLEIRTVLQTVVARTELQAPDPAPERTRLRNVTLVPRRGARVVMSRRREAEQPAGAAATYA
jgi:cytochrome P450